MSFAPAQLRRLLGGGETIQGQVMGKAQNGYQIATAKGLVIASSLEPLRAGDRVAVANGIATRVPVARATFAV